MSSHNLINREIREEICPQLQQLRLKHGLSIEDLHIAVHISSKMLQRIEKNKGLTFSNLRKLLVFYGKKVRIVLDD